MSDLKTDFQAPYGFCPDLECGALGKTRERRPNGFDTCVNGCKYPSRLALSYSPVNYTDKIKALEQKLSDAEKQNEVLRKEWSRLNNQVSCRFNGDCDYKSSEQNEWISVEDDLPDDGEYYLYDGKRVYIDKMYKGFFHSGLFINKYVTHWKPITPPEVDKDE